MGDKKSTVLLTVVAVATLLVAVVGASFAFFAASTDDLEGKVDVSTQTAAGSDVFASAGAATLSLSVTNDKMMPTNADNTEAAIVESTTDADYNGEKLVVSLTAGSGVATCTYKLKYVDTPADANTTPETIVYTPSAAMTTGLKEYTIEGTDGTQTFEATNVDGLATFLASDANKFTISNTYGQAKTEQTWDFTAKFYNLEDSQDELINKKFAGTITVDPDSIVCTNAAA